MKSLIQVSLKILALKLVLDIIGFLSLFPEYRDSNIIFFLSLLAMVLTAVFLWLFSGQIAAIIYRKDDILNINLEHEKIELVLINVFSIIIITLGLSNMSRELLYLLFYIRNDFSLQENEQLKLNLILNNVKYGAQIFLGIILLIRYKGIMKIIKKYRNSKT